MRIGIALWQVPRRPAIECGKEVSQLLLWGNGIRPAPVRLAPSHLFGRFGHLEGELIYRRRWNAAAPDGKKQVRIDALRGHDQLSAGGHGGHADEAVASPSQPPCERPCASAQDEAADAIAGAGACRDEAVGLLEQLEINLRREMPRW